MTNPESGASAMTEQQLALWMLDRMQNSAEFIDVLRKARVDGAPHFLDSPDLVEPHLEQLRKLHEGDDEEVVDLPPTVIGKLAALMERDLLSGPEEFMEKALAAYIERSGDRSLQPPIEPTIEMARAEIEGRTTGMFDKGFVAGLAQEAREELAREAERERDRGSERDGRES